MTKSRYYPIFINGGGGGKDPELTDITVTPTKEEQTFPTPEGFDGIANVTVEGYTPNNTPITVAPSLQDVTYNTPIGFDGIANVTVEGVTSDIDQNIKPQNIKKDVEILGVVGTMESGVEVYDKLKFTVVEGYTGSEKLNINATRMNLFRPCYSFDDVNYIDLPTDGDGYFKTTQNIYLTTSNVVYVKHYGVKQVNEINTGYSLFGDNTGYSKKTYLVEGELNLNYGCLLVSPQSYTKFYFNLTLNLNNAYQYYYLLYNSSNTSYIDQFENNLVVRGDTIHKYQLSYLTTGCYGFNINAPNVKYVLNNGCSYLSTYYNVISSTYAPKTINLPNLEFIGANAFDHCFYNNYGITNYQNIKLKGNLGQHACYYMYAKCANLKSVPKDIFNEITNWGNYTFQYMFSESGITESPILPMLPIGSNSGTSYMFSNCKSLVKANEIHFTGNVTSYTSNLFYNCTALKEMTWTATTPPTINASMWQGCPTDMVIYVPDSSVDAYKEANVWKSRAAYIKGISEKPTE